MPFIIESAIVGLCAFAMIAIAANAKMNPRSLTMPVLINVIFHRRNSFHKNFVSRLVMKWMPGMESFCSFLSWVINKSTPNSDADAK